MANLDTVAAELRHVNDYMAKLDDQIKNAAVIMNEYGGDAKKYRMEKFGPDVTESPIQKENRLEAAKLEQEQHDEQQHNLEAIHKSVLDIVSILKLGGTAGTGSLLKGLGIGGLLGGLASAALAPIAVAAEKIFKGVKGTANLLGPLGSMFRRSPASGAVTVASGAAKIAEEVEDVVKARPKKGFFRVPAWLGKAREFFKLDKLVFGPVKFVLGVIGQIGKAFVDIGKFIMKNPIIRFATKFLKIILTPIMILLGTIDTLRAAYQGYTKDGIKGAIIGAISGFIDFVTFGLFPTGKLYDSIMSLWTSTTKSFSLLLKGEIWAAFKNILGALAKFNIELTDMIVKGFADLGAWILDLLGFKEASEKLKKFSDSFSVINAAEQMIHWIGKVISDLENYLFDIVEAIPNWGPFAAFKIAAQSTPWYNKIRTAKDTASKAALVADATQKAADIVRLDSRRSALMAEGSPEAMMAANQITRQLDSKTVALASISKASGVIIPPTARGIENPLGTSGARLTTQSDQNSMLRAYLASQKATIIAPATAVVAPANNNRAEPIIAPVPVRNNESTFIRQSTRDSSW